VSPTKFATPERPQLCARYAEFDAKGALCMQVTVTQTFAAALNPPRYHLYNATRPPGHATRAHGVFLRALVIYCSR
jgi:hypothetical protein